MIVTTMNWIFGQPSEKSELMIKYRHGADIHQVHVEHADSAWVMTLAQESKQGIAAGQFAVLYDGDVCLGGGVIDKAF